MEPRRFVRVVVRFDQGKIRRGTGYLLSRNRVLTARHVVAGDGRITVELDREDAEAAAATVRWQSDPGDKDLDAAVLECGSDLAAPNVFTQLAAEPLAQTSDWESRGCASAVPADKGMASLNGRAFKTDAQDRRFEVTVEAPPKDVKDWRGISGAPVFVSGRIHGVIQEAPESFEGRRLYATPIHRLLTLDDFAKAVGLADLDKWKPLLSEVRKLLEDDATAARTLAEQLPSWRQAFGNGGTEALATAFERTEFEETLLPMHKAHGALAGKPARTIEKILERILPVLCDRHLVYSLPAEPGGVVLRVPVATATVAEMVMAGVDVRALRYQPVSDRKDLPVGEARVPSSSPEPGIDYGGVRAFKEFVDHLAAQFVDDESRRRLPKEPEERRYDELAGMVDDELDWQAKGGGGLRYYFLFDSSFGEEHEDFLGLVRKSLPALRLIELTSQDVRSERRLCLPLRDLLYRSQTQQEDAR